MEDQRLDLHTLTDPLVAIGMLDPADVGSRLFKIEWEPHVVRAHLYRLNEHGNKFRDPDNPEEPAVDVVEWPTVWTR